MYFNRCKRNNRRYYKKSIINNFIRYPSEINNPIIKIKFKLIKEELDEFYSVDYKDKGYGIDILEVGYSEESYSVFYKVKV